MRAGSSLAPASPLRRLYPCAGSPYRSPPTRGARPEPFRVGERVAVQANRLLGSIANPPRSAHGRRRDRGPVGQAAQQLASARGVVRRDERRRGPPNALWPARRRQPVSRGGPGCRRSPRWHSPPPTRAPCSPTLAGRPQPVVHRELPAVLGDLRDTPCVPLAVLLPPRARPPRGIRSADRERAQTRARIAVVATCRKLEETDGPSVGRIHVQAMAKTHHNRGLLSIPKRQANRAAQGLQSMQTRY